MKTIIIDIDSNKKAQELSQVLIDMKHVKHVSIVNKHKDIIEALEEHEAVKKKIVGKKNKAIAKYL